MGNFYQTKKVIIAEDSSTVQRIIQQKLEGMGFANANIKVVDDGKIALDSIKATKFDLILSDWHMPNMDGLALLKAVKKEKDFAGIPFLMVTSASEEKDKQQAFESGADQYVTKPFSSEILAKTIHQLLTETIVFGDKRVLVVDDSGVFRKIFVKNLKQAGFHPDHIEESENGEEALKSLASSRFDLIFTDWHMPKMDGLEFTKRIRANDRLKSIPVLMVTSEIQKEKIMEAIRQGVTGYIIKPFNAIDLQKKVRSIFEGQS